MPSPTTNFYHEVLQMSQQEKQDKKDKTLSVTSSSLGSSWLSTTWTRKRPNETAVFPASRATEAWARGLT